MESEKGVKAGDVLWQCDCETEWFDDGGVEMAEIHISTKLGGLTPCFVVSLGDGLGYTRPDFTHQREDGKSAYASVYRLGEKLKHTPLEAMRYDLAMKREAERGFRLAAEWLEREIGRVERGDAEL